MAENRGICGQAGGQGRETVCIDTYRVLDASRDRDCYEDVRVYLTPFGQEIIDRTCNVRVRGCEVAGCTVSVDPIQFNCGFYQLTVRYYITLTLESCMGQGRAQEFFGMTVLEKRSVLYGGEGDVKVYSSADGSSSCNFDPRDQGNNAPVGVVETVDPIALSVKVCDRNALRGCCFCTCDQIPRELAANTNGELVDPEDGNRLFVSLGIFSVLRLQRPAQLLVNAADYSVPDKESVPVEESDPCKLFRSMAFPASEFSGTNCAGQNQNPNQRPNSQDRGGCGCRG
ncbi:MAG: hypothetical protein J6X72_06645 [Clostridia bacterium]|nr:hypothetical protein [Clostridia bacterium]